MLATSAACPYNEIEVWERPAVLLGESDAC